MNPADHKNVSLELNFARGFGCELVVARVDLARLQRASEGSRESTRCCGYDVIECRSMGRIGIGRDLVMFGDLGMDAKGDRFFLRG
jgi:hypothetical protein